MLLQGVTIALIEDEPVIALGIIDSLEEHGATVIGPGRSLVQSLRIFEERQNGAGIDCAILDYQLTDGTSEPLARWLSEKNIPYFFHTADPGAKASLKAAFAAHVLMKPASEENLIEALTGCINA